MYIQERLQQLQQWTRTGASLTKLPSVENYGSEESELALLQYCYYRLIDHVAGVIIEHPNYDAHELVEVLLSSPFGNCVSKEIVISLCELLTTSDLRQYCQGTLFAPYWTVSDVAGSIYSLQGGSKDLLKAAIGNNTPISPRQIIEEQELIDTLQNNAVFQLSLSSKELFHSNFLYWLATDSHTLELFKDVLKLFGASISANYNHGQFIAKREYKNFDFCICERDDSAIDGCGEIVFLLENKFKSIANNKQLEEYCGKVLLHNAEHALEIYKRSVKPIAPDTEVNFQKERYRKEGYSTLKKEVDRIKDAIKLNNVPCVNGKLPALTLLSLQNPNNSITQKCWNVVTYKSYASLLAVNVYKVNDSFSRQMISKYADFIACFADFVDSNMPNDIVNEKWDIVDGKNCLKTIRMNDIWVKLIGSNIVELLSTTLSKKGYNVWTDLSCKEILDSNSIVKKGEVSVTCGMTRSTEFITINLKVSNDMLFNIQIQGGEYRRCIEMTDKDAKSKAKGYIIEYAKTNCPFLLDMFCLPPKTLTHDYYQNVTEGCLYPNSKKIFNMYGEGFKYQHKRLKQDVVISDVIDAIISDIDYVKKNI